MPAVLHGARAGAAGVPAASFLFGSPVSKLVLPQDAPRRPPRACASQRRPVVDGRLRRVLDANLAAGRRQRHRSRLASPTSPTLARRRRPGTATRPRSTARRRWRCRGCCPGGGPTPDNLPIATDYPNSLFSSARQEPLLPRDRDGHGGLLREPVRRAGARAPVGSRLRSLAKDLGHRVVAPARAGGGAVEACRPSTRRSATSAAAVATRPTGRASRTSHRQRCATGLAQFDTLLRGIGADRGPAGAALPPLHAAAHPVAVPAEAASSTSTTAPTIRASTGRPGAPLRSPARLGLQRHLLQVGVRRSAGGAPGGAPAQRGDLRRGDGGAHRRPRGRLPARRAAPCSHARELQRHSRRPAADQVPGRDRGTGSTTRRRARSTSCRRSPRSWA